MHEHTLFSEHLKEKRRGTIENGIETKAYGFTREPYSFDWTANVFLPLFVCSFVHCFDFEIFQVFGHRSVFICVEGGKERKVEERSVEERGNVGGGRRLKLFTCVVFNLSKLWYEQIDGNAKFSAGKKCEP